MAKAPTKRAVAVRKKRTPAKPKVTEQQERFIQEYLVDLNATQAAKRAGYSQKTAYSQGQRLLKHVVIAARLAEARREWAERVGITQDAVLSELAAIGFSRASTFLRSTPDGDVVVDISDITDLESAAIKSVETTKTTTGGGDTGRDVQEITKTKIILHDKRLPLRDIGQHLGMFEGDKNVSPITVNVKEIRLVGVLPDGVVDAEFEEVK